MKYDEKSSFPKSVGLTGLYTIIALCLVVVGAIAWFAVARKSGKTEISEGGSSKKNSYSSNYSSYNSNDDDPLPDTESTAKDKDDVPYEEVEKEEAPEAVPQTFIMPVDGAVIKDFSETVLQYSKTYGDMRLHLGIDIKCEKNSNIKAVSNGTVTDITDSALYGKTIVIDHGNGITAKYCGMGKIDVKSGDKVDSSTIIGIIGTVPSECADETHLHFEVYKNGKAVSPLKGLGFE